MIAAALVNTKPGTTKTTSAVFLAHALHTLALRVLLVDADPAGSAQRWADLADGFPFHVMGYARPRTIARDLPALVREYDAVVIDTPQMEDHAQLTRGAMSAVGQLMTASGRGWWIVPVAPAGIEIDRTMSVLAHMDEVAGLLPREPERLALLTRTNTREPTAHGKDADARAALEDNGLPVFGRQVPQHDTLYRQGFGLPVDVAHPAAAAYVDLARKCTTIPQHA